MELKERTKVKELEKEVVDGITYQWFYIDDPSTGILGEFAVTSDGAILNKEGIPLEDSDFETNTVRGILYRSGIADKFFEKGNKMNEEKKKLEKIDFELKRFEKNLRDRIKNQTWESWKYDTFDNVAYLETWRIVGGDHYGYSENKVMNLLKPIIKKVELEIFGKTLIESGKENPMKRENEIEIQEEVTIEQDDKKIILEKGDRIEILNEVSGVSIFPLGRVNLLTGNNKTLGNLFDTWLEDDTICEFWETSEFDKPGKVKLIIGSGTRPYAKVGESKQFYHDQRRSYLFYAELIDHCLLEDLLDMSRKYGKSLSGYVYK